MNPITLMLLTVLANAIVTGIIVYLIQKRIERSYTRQMEEFKASLQYSNFEHQTKFTDSYAKRVKTLEGLFERYIALAQVLKQASSEAQGNRNLVSDPRFEKEEMEKIHFDDKESEEKLYEFRHFYDNNTLYLSAEENEALFRIYANTFAIRGMISYLSIRPNIDTVPSILVEMLPEFDKIKEAEDFDLSNPVFLLNRMEMELSSYSHTLENLYKSEAGIKVLAPKEYKH